METVLVFREVSLYPKKGGVFMVRHKKGMTLLELLIAVGLFAIFMTAAAFFFTRSNQLFSEGQKSSFNFRMESLGLTMLTSDLRGYTKTFSSPNSLQLTSQTSQNFSLVPNGAAFLFYTQNNPNTLIVYFINGQDDLVRGTVNLGSSSSNPPLISQLTGKITDIFAYSVSSLNFSSVGAGSGFSLVTISMDSNSSLSSQNTPITTSLLLPLETAASLNPNIIPPPVIPSPPVSAGSYASAAVAAPAPSAVVATPAPSAAPSVRVRAMRMRQIVFPPLTPSSPSNPNVGAPIKFNIPLPSAPPTFSSPSAPTYGGSGGTASTM
jgi:prepilin-type N-terminal cleavage/methylation domain-containing protein